MKQIRILALAVAGVAVSLACLAQSAAGQTSHHCDVRDSNCRTGFSESFCHRVNGQLECNGTGRCCTNAEPTLRPNELVLEGLEATQAIQNMSHNVTLIAGKTTWVRAYLGANVKSPLTVSGILTVRNAAGATTTITAAFPAIINPAQNGILRAKRESMTAALNFLVPTAFTRPGLFEFQLSAVTDTASGSALACPTCASSQGRLTFVCAPPLRLRIVGIAAGAPTTGDTVKGRSCGYPNPRCRGGFAERFCRLEDNQWVCDETDTCCTAPKSSPAKYAPSAIDYALLRSWLRRAFPVSQVLATETLLVSPDSWPYTCEQVNALLAALRAQDLNQGSVDARTHYLGLVSTNFGGFMRGCSSGIPDSPDPTVVASGPTGPPASAGSVGFGDRDGSFGDWYGGHELAHTLGRYHPGFCNGNSSDDSNFPFPNGQLSTNDGAFTAIDVGENAIIPAIPAILMPGAANFDIMTYCQQPQWLSSYAYEGVRQRLLEENGGNCGTGSSSSPLKVQTGQFVSIVARVNLTLKTASILYVNRVNRVQLPVRHDGRKAVLRVLDERAELLQEYPVWLREQTDVTGEQQRMALVEAVIPYSPAMSRVQLLVDGEILDQLFISKHPPVVTNVKVSAPTDDNLTIDWEARDEDDDNLNYIVQVSSGSRKWETLVLGLREPQLHLTRYMIGSRRPRVRVIANDGFHSSRPVSVPILPVSRRLGREEP